MSVKPEVHRKRLVRFRFPASSRSSHSADIYKFCVSHLKLLRVLLPPPLLLNLNPIRNLLFLLLRNLLSPSVLMPPPLLLRQQTPNLPRPPQPILLTQLHLLSHLPRNGVLPTGLLGRTSQTTSIPSTSLRPATGRGRSVWN